MPFKVELRPEAAEYVRHYCSDQERVQFRDSCRRISEDPISHSEMCFDANVSRFVMRYFVFGAHIAVFSFDRARSRVRIQKCRRLQKPGPDAPNPDDLR